MAEDTEGNFWDWVRSLPGTARDLYTGANRDPEYADVGEVGPDYFGVEAPAWYDLSEDARRARGRRALPFVLGALSSDEAQYADMLEANTPENLRDYYTRDATGRRMIDHPEYGRAYLNEPGATGRDWTRLTRDMAALYPAARGIGAVGNTWARMGLGGLAGTGYSAGMDEVAEQTGSEQDIDWDRAALTGLVEMITAGMMPSGVLKRSDDIDELLDDVGRIRAYRDRPRTEGEFLMHARDPEVISDQHLRNIFEGAAEDFRAVAGDFDAAPADARRVAEELARDTGLSTREMAQILAERRELGAMFTPSQLRDRLGRILWRESQEAANSEDIAIMYEAANALRQYGAAQNPVIRRHLRNNPDLGLTGADVIEETVRRTQPNPGQLNQALRDYPVRQYSAEAPGMAATPTYWRQFAHEDDQGREED